MHPKDPHARPDGEPVDWAYETPAPTRRREEIGSAPETISPMLAARRDTQPLDLPEDGAWEDLGKGVLVLGLTALSVAGLLAFLAAILAFSA